MELAGSIALATAVLALGLIIESRILLSNPDQLKLLTKRIQKFAVIVAIPLGIIFIIVGSIWLTSIGSFISVGVTLIIIAIALLVQSKILSNPNDPSLQKFGKLIRIYAIILAVAAFIALVSIVVKLITMLT